MVVVMEPTASDSDVARVVDAVVSAGGEAFVSRGVHQTIVGLIGDVAAFEALPLPTLDGVERVLRVSRPYKLVARDHHRQSSSVTVGRTVIGPGTFAFMAGPCAVESEEQTRAAARMAAAAGASVLRGGAFKPRTSPYAFQGLGLDGLKILSAAAAEVGLPVVTEVVQARDVETVAAHADMLQVGARNMQNFQLLKEVGLAGKPVLLKRGMSATIEEWLMAAEYVAQQGSLAIVLCERGIRTFEPATRFTLDLSAVPVVQALSHLPVIVDPSHASGERSLVAALSRAALAAGADGVIIDVHPSPETALCDGPQALTGDEPAALGRDLARWAPLADRSLATP